MRWYFEILQKCPPSLYSRLHNNSNWMKKNLTLQESFPQNQCFSSYLNPSGFDFRTRSPRPFSKLRPTTDGACATLRCGRWQKAIPFGQSDGRWGRLWVDESCCNPKQNNWWVSQVTPWKFWLLSLKLASLLRCEWDEFLSEAATIPMEEGTRTWMYHCITWIFYLPRVTINY